MNSRQTYICSSGWLIVRLVIDLAKRDGTMGRRVDGGGGPWAGAAHSVRVLTATSGEAHVSCADEDEAGAAMLQVFDWLREI
jgi:hypothetical protein